jgi:hypothetical protein
MIKKKFNDDLFDCLNWVLKKTIKDTNSLNFPNSFVFNRWLSMADNTIAQIINATTNRWITKSDLAKNPQSLCQFYRVLLPRINSRINYLKKSLKTPNNKEDTEICSQMEISQREINFYNKTLDELKTSIK